VTDWKLDEMEEQGPVLVGLGHIPRPADDETLMAVLEPLRRELGEDWPSLLAQWQVGGWWEHTHRGGDPTGEYGWLTCDAAGASGYMHYCDLDVPCVVHGEHDDDFEDYGACRCDKPWCEGDDTELVATDPYLITVVSIDQEKVWGAERREQMARRESSRQVVAQ